MNKVFSPHLGGVSDAEAQQNLSLLTSGIADYLQVDPRNMTYDQRLQYDRLIAQSISQNPDLYTDQMVANANASLGKNYSNLDNVGIGAETGFVGSVEDTLLGMGSKVADLGNGVLDLTSGAGKLLSGAGKGAANAGATAQYALPVVLIVALGIGAVALRERTRGRKAT